MERPEEDSILSVTTPNPTQEAQFVAITEEIINPCLLKRNTCYYHACCRAFNKRNRGPSPNKEEINSVDDLERHGLSFRISELFSLPRDEQGNRLPLHPTDAWKQFRAKIYEKGLYQTHDWDKPFIINQKLCQQKVNKVNSLLIESQKVQELTIKRQEDHELQLFKEMQHRLDSLEEQLTLKDEQIALQARLISEITKKKKDKTKLIVKQKAKIIELEEQNKLLKEQSKVRLVYQPQMTSHYDRPEESSYKRPSDSDSIGHLHSD